MCLRVLISFKTCEVVVSSCTKTLIEVYVFVLDFT